jgi:hypothetical protein
MVIESRCSGVAAMTHPGRDAALKCACQPCSAHYFMTFPLLPALDIQSLDGISG